MVVPSEVHESVLGQGEVGMDMDGLWGGGLTDKQVEGGRAEVFERAMELDG